MTADVDSGNACDAPFVVTLAVASGRVGLEDGSAGGATAAAFAPAGARMATGFAAFVALGTTVVGGCGVSRGGVAAATIGADSVDVERAQPTGGTTCTMLPHLGHMRISPITDPSLTLSRARQVVH